MRVETGACSEDARADIDTQTPQTAYGSIRENTRMGILVAISKQEIENRYFFEEYLAKQFAQCLTMCRAR